MDRATTLEFGTTGTNGVSVVVIILRSGIETLKTLANTKNNNKNERSQSAAVCLPDDFTINLPAEPLQWLRKYGITDVEIVNNHIGWSESNGYLVYPCFGVYGSLLCYQGRYFCQYPTNQRFYTSGQVEKTYHILENNFDYPNTICLVEDMVSCIKIAKHVSCMPLFGSTIKTERFIHLGNIYTNLIIWLDKDKAQYAVKRGKVAEAFFDKVRVIITEKDPKDYDNGQLREYLSQS